MWELGGLGAAVGKSEEVDLFAKGGVGVGGRGDHVGKQTASHLPTPRVMLRRAFLRSLRVFFSAP